MSSKVICDLCGQEIAEAQGRYSLEVNHINGFLSKGEESLDLHGSCMFKLGRIMEHCRNGEIASLDEVLQFLET